MEDPVIKKLRESAAATKSWPESMKKLHAIRLKADAYFRKVK